VPSSLVFNVARDAAETETDPWSLVGGGLQGEKTAADFRIRNFQARALSSLFY
jgi:hypothetical protein